MDQLREGLAIAMQPEQAAPYLEAAQKQISDWGLTMPHVDPLVMDFGLRQFSEIGEIEFWITNEEEAGYCGKYLYMAKGQTCPKHMHKDKLETFFIVKGRIEMLYAERKLNLSAGGTLLVETGNYHEFSALEPSLILEISRPSVISDNYFADPRIPFGGNFTGMQH